MAESYFVITNGKIMLETIRLGVGDRVSNLIYHEVSGASTTSKTYVWGQDLSGSIQGAGGVGGILSSRDLIAGSSSYYTYDANGNVSEIIDNAGTVQAHYEYDPFGNVVIATGALASENEFQFSTKYFDAETGLNYYGFRYYSADLGRWINRDPIEEQGGFNLYAFVGNDGINQIDILGLTKQTQECCKKKLRGSSSRVYCCCKGERIQRRPKSTGVQWCTVNDFMGWIPFHRYLLLPSGKTIGGAGGIALMPDPWGRPNNPNNSCNPIGKLSPCKYDIKKFNKCLENSSGCNLGGGQNCIQIAKTLLSKCKKEAEKDCDDDLRLPPKTEPRP